MVLRMKNFNILRIHWKIRLLEGCLQKTNIEEGISEKGGFGQFVNLRGGFSKESGVVILKGEVDTPMHTMLYVYV